MQTRIVKTQVIFASVIPGTVEMGRTVMVCKYSNCKTASNETQLSRQIFKIHVYTVMIITNFGLNETNKKNSALDYTLRDLCSTMYYLQNHIINFQHDVYTGFIFQDRKEVAKFLPDRSHTQFKRLWCIFV